MCRYIKLHLLLIAILSQTFPVPTLHVPTVTDYVAPQEIWPIAIACNKLLPIPRTFSKKKCATVAHRASLSRHRINSLNAHYHAHRKCTLHQILASSRQVHACSPLLPVRYVGQPVIVYNRHSVQATD